jgi:hypothetical protein
VLSRTKPVVVDVWRRLQGGVTLLLCMAAFAGPMYFI